VDERFDMETKETVSRQAERQAIFANVRAKMKEKSIAYTRLADMVEKDPMFIAAALHGWQKLSFTDGEKVANALGLNGEEKNLYWHTL
jgi:cyanate lyase